MTIMYRGHAILFLALLASVPAGMVEANLLFNPSFESGSSSPSNWNMWGDGTFTWQTGGARTGSKCMSLGDESGPDFALMYQRASGSAGNSYEVRGWAKHSSGSSTGTVKLEFHDSGAGEIEQHHLNFAPEADWAEYTITKTAPAGTGLVTATIVGGDGGMVLFDDISLMQVETPEPTDPVFDLSNISHTFLGFGAQIWGHGSDATYPNLEAIRQQALSELNIKYVRIDNTAALAPMQRTKAMTDALGIKWISMIWAAPGAYTSGGMLSDIPGFATWWTNHVLYYESNGIPIEYIELMNEPDSGGSWSTGITYSDYNLLVKDLRPKLDTAGLQSTGIVGPGPAGLWAYPGYSNALDATGISSVSAWSTHLWDNVNNSGPSVENTVETQFVNYALGDNANYIRIVSEYATYIQNVDGYWYPHADRYHIDQAGNDTLYYDEARTFPYYSQTNSMPFAVKVYENTLSILNGGANVPMVWQAIDEPVEVQPTNFNKDDKHKSWGLLDLWGNPKPVYGALKTLYPEIPVGANVLVPPDQTANDLYTAAFTKDNKVIVAIANTTSTSQSNTIYLTNGPGDLEIIKATAFERTYFGDPADSDPDIGQEVSKSLTLVETSPGDYSIDVTLVAHSTLTIVMCAKSEADIDGDCDVDIEDLRDFVGVWLTDANDADFDNSGTVDGIDFGTVTKDWQQGIN